jgi:signal transduction histidine kinase
MNKSTVERQTPRRFRHLPMAVTCLTLLVFAATIGLGARHLRQTIRKQIVERDGEALYAVVQMLESEAAADATFDGVRESPAGQLLVVFKASELKDVIGIRVFDAEGNFYGAAPAAAMEGQLSTSDFTRLKEFGPINRYQSAARLDDLFLLAQKRTAPLLEVILPLHTKPNSPLLGAAQFLIDGQSLKDRFAALDNHLSLTASAVFLVGSFIVTGAMTWAFRRLQRANQLLEDRTVRLQRANQELVLAAKTSAVGAVTAHLLHGLKNPLSGLHNFVASRAQEELSNGTDSDWETAYDSTRRMRSLINEVVAILGDAQETSNYEVSLDELVECVERRIHPLATSAGIRFESQVRAAATLPSRVANLVMLILANLLQNAIQATPNGKSVRLVIAEADGDIICEVHDEGPGIPVDFRGLLFTPCPSAKEGGTGIGLAISKQLANHLEARLELKRSTPQGCVFSLSLPAKNLLGESAMASHATRD